MRTFILAVLFAFSSMAAVAQSSALVERQWKVDGVERLALVYAPAPNGNSSRTKMPLIFAFHGHGGTMRYAANKFGYHRVWPEAIVIYMQGLPTPGVLTDPQGKRNGWQKSVGDQNDRDLKFFDAVLASLKKEYSVDDKRIYATGHSNGGSFTYLLWAERGETFAAVAPAAAAAGRSLLRLKPKPALHVAGENDELVRFPLQQRTMEAVRKLNGCTEEGKSWATAGTLVGTRMNRTKSKTA
jgi:polyhydroxybutyrate depolymerase